MRSLSNAAAAALCTVEMGQCTVHDLPATSDAGSCSEGQRLATKVLSAVSDAAAHANTPRGAAVTTPDPVPGFTTDDVAAAVEAAARTDFDMVRGVGAWSAASPTRKGAYRDRLLPSVTAALTALPGRGQDGPVLPVEVTVEGIDRLLFACSELDDEAGPNKEGRLGTSVIRHLLTRGDLSTYNYLEWEKEGDTTRG